MLPIHFKPFQPGSKLPATPKITPFISGVTELSENDKITLEAVKPLRAKPDLQIKTAIRLMEYYK